MARHGDCRKCSLRMDVDPAQLEDTLRYMRERLQTELNEEEESAVKLAACLKCSALQYGSTCKYSGRLVRIQTKVRHASCPNPANPQW